MAYVGAGTDAADAAQPAYLIINGIKIGFTSASGMEDSYDMAAGDGKAGILEYTEAEQYTKVIQEAATKCDYLIVYDHEGKGMPMVWNPTRKSMQLHFAGRSGYRDWRTF